jgi:hypothetical protein
MPFPDLSDTALFPPFAGLPTETEHTTLSATEGSGKGDWWLLGQVKENMTITKPTLVLTDRSGVDFALTFEDKRTDLRPFRKGSTAIVPRARRTAPGEEGRKGFVKIDVGDGGVKVLGVGLEKLLELGGMIGRFEDGDGSGSGRCDCCAEEGSGLLKCTGCRVARYCGKVCTLIVLICCEGIRKKRKRHWIFADCLQECQSKAWTERGHKADCKVFRAMIQTWDS